MLLSLDRTRPFHDVMSVPIPRSHDLVSLLREAISANRDAFAREPSYFPDLARLVLAMLDQTVGGAFASEFERWVERGHVLAPRDMLPGMTWFDVLGYCRRHDDRWAQLGFPAGVSAEARARLGDNGEGKAADLLDDEVRARVLSAWDTEMYILHDLFVENADPWNTINIVIEKRRIVRYVRWLAGSLSGEERAALLVSVRAMQASFSFMKGIEPVLPLEEVIRAHADDFA